MPRVEDVEETPAGWRSTRHVICTICRQDDPEPAFEVDGHHIVRCRQCSHLYVSPRPEIDDIVRIYGEDYFENPAFRTADHDAYFGYNDYLADRPNIELRLQQVLDQIEALQPGRGRLLDVGCGLGLFVDVANRAGWDGYGTDLNEQAVKWAQENISEQVTVGTVADIGADDGFFDCVTMFDVIEHVADPRVELAEMWRVLRPGGMLVVVTPDAGSLVSRALGRHWLEMKRAPEHLHFFDVRGLGRLLSLAGFDFVQWHSIGKISTVRGMIADLRFYSEGAVNAVERGLERTGLADRVIDVDPRTKMCAYARKAGPAAELVPGALPAEMELPRVAGKGIGRPGIRRVKSATFRSRQRRYWESKQRFLDPHAPGPTAFALPKLDWAAQHLPLDGTATILDVGAGNGTVTWHLAARARRVTGIDFSTNLLRRSPCPELMAQADAEHLPFRDREFDIVVESNFLHHVTDAPAVLQEMVRVSKRYLLLIEPNRWHAPMSAFMALNPSEHRGLRFDQRHVELLAEQAGLRVIAIAPQGAVYPNITPPSLLPKLRRFDEPGPLGAYVVAVLERPEGGL